MKTLERLTAVSLILLFTVSKVSAQDAIEDIPTFRVPSGTETEQKVRAKLAKVAPYPLIFEDNTIQEAMQYIVDASDIPVYFEPFSDFDSVFRQNRITIQMGEGTIEDVFNIFCKHSSTEFLVEDSLLKFVPKEVASSRFETVVYDLREFRKVEYPTEELPAVLQKTVAPGTWAVQEPAKPNYDNVSFDSSKKTPTSDLPKSDNRHSKNGTIVLVPHGLVVYQSQPVQREIEHTLQKLWFLAKRSATAKKMFVPDPDKMFLPEPAILPLPNLSEDVTDQES